MTNWFLNSLHGKGMRKREKHVGAVFLDGCLGLMIPSSFYGPDTGCRITSLDQGLN